MTAATPGQAAYEAMHRSLKSREADGAHPLPWDGLDEFWDDAGTDGLHREDMEAGAQAAIDVFLAGDSVSAGIIREAIAAQDARPAPAVTAKALAAALALRPIKVRVGNGWETRMPLYPDALAAELLDTIKIRSADTEPQPAPELADAAMREAASKELAAAMAEARGYREALQQVAKHHDDEIAQVRIIAKIAKRALEGK